MKIHRELEIKGPQQEVFELIDRLGNEPGPGWRRNPEAEKELERAGSRQFCFTSDASSGHAPASLWIAWRSDADYARVSNIIPMGVSSLTTDEYNDILLNFVTRTKLEEHAKARNILVLLTPSEVDIGYWHLSPQTVELLRGFSNLANKSTGSSHPRDRDRWFQFLISAHQDRATLHADMLGRWLSEEQGWPDDTASDLISEYEFARDLLHAYDQKRG